MRFATDRRSDPLPALPVQYADFAAWQRDWLASGVMEQQLAYWRSELADLPRIELPTDRPRPPTRSFRGGCLEVGIDPGVTRGLIALGRRCDATLFMTLLAAWQLLLGRYAGQADVAVGTPVANRSQAELEPLIGLFVNTLVLRADLSDAPSFIELLGQVRARALRAYAHQDVPFERVVDEVDPERDLSRNALFDVMFSLQEALPAHSALGDLQAAFSSVEAGVARFDLTLLLSPTPDGLRGTLEFSTDLFDASSVRGLWDSFCTLLEAILDDPDRCVWDLALLGPEEQRRVLVEWNATAAEVPHGPCVHDLFAEQVRRTPDAAAVVLGEAVSYRELDLRSEELAHHLRSLGVGPEVLVGICVERSIEMVVGLLGILKAGGAYLPLDPSYPEERLTFMIADAGARVLLTQASLEQRWRSQSIPTVVLDASADVPRAQPRERLSSGVVADNLAYVIYTSGSTGRPKGVGATHRGLCNLVGAQRRLFELGPHSRVLQFASLCFDASIWEVVMALCNGACLCLWDPGTAAGDDALSQVVRRQRVTHATLPPSTLQTMAPGDLEGVTTLIVAGEACSAEVAAEWSAGRAFFNAYGPTETTVCATAALHDGCGGRPSIGTPIANLAAYVLGPRLEPVPPGVAGELYISGASVTRGYLGRPGLTAERFVPDPFATEVGARMYRTGDRCRWRVDGRLEFLGRTDDQVKVRGFRIELGEVEAALGSLDQVSRCAVLAPEATQGHRQLVAFVEPTDPQAVTGVVLRRALEGAVPDYLVPDRFVVLESLPVSPNGKIHRRALRALDVQGAGGEGYVPPRTDTEARLARIWAEVLGLDRVGVHDNFFDVGGDSILSIRVVSRARAAGLSLTARGLFENQTIARLADALGGTDAAGGVADGQGWSSPPAVRMRAGDATPFFCVHPLWGGVDGLANLAQCLDPARPFVALRARGVEVGEEPLRSVEEMARHYNAALRRLQRGGPYLIGGWSFGGAVAYEMSRQLLDAGERVAALVMLDFRFAGWGGGDAIGRRDPFFDLADLLRDYTELVQGSTVEVEETAEQLRTIGLEAATREVAGRLTAMGLDVGEPAAIEMVRRGVAISEAHHHAAYSYEVRPLPVSLTLIRPDEGPVVEPIGSDEGRTFDALVRTVDVRAVPGGHVSMMRDPHVAEVGRVLGEVLERADRIGSEE